MALVVLDTHVALWWSLAARPLGKKAARALTDAERIGIPTVCFWETAVLVRKGKLALEMPVREWAQALLRIPRVAALPLTSAAALHADDLPMHPDPSDRFIVATAIEQEAPLLTKDRLIRKLRFLPTLW